MYLISFLSLRRQRQASLMGCRTSSLLFNTKTKALSSYLISLHKERRPWGDDDSREGPWREMPASADAMEGRSIQSMEKLLLFAKLFLGAVTGGLIRQVMEGGLFRDTGITSMLVSIEVVDSSIRLRHSRRSRIWSILYVTMATFELYWQSTIGMCLTETLNKIVSSGTLCPELAIQVLVQFDKSMKEALENQVKIKVTVKQGPISGGNDTQHKDIFDITAKREGRAMEELL